METKYCGGCKQTLPVKSFNKNRGRKDGLQTQCAVCICTQAKKTRNSKKRMDYDTQYRKNWKVDPIKKAHFSELRRINDRKNYRENIEHKLKTIVSVHIRSALNEEYEPHVFKHLGYTPTQLKEHLESQFTSRMSWDNHGQYGWHIDHIVPQSSLPFTDYTDENFLKCWSLDNLQPLWWDENLAKGSK
jgi:hypothetical protein